MNKTTFVSYETLENALLNELATEAKTKGSKARTLKGSGYYIKYDGVQYDITAEQCRMYKLIRNNYNHFVTQLNSAKSDVLGVWKAVWGDRLADTIASIEKCIEICEKYFDAFKSFITEVETTKENDETVEKNDETENVVSTTSENETISTSESETSESDNNASVPETKTTTEDVDVDALIEELRDNDIIFDDDKICVNEDEYEITVDIYRNGQWCSNIVLYEYD